VKNPDTYDYKKLTHVMQYLRGMQDLTPMIEPGEQPNWWVESLYTGGWKACILVGGQHNPIGRKWEDVEQ